MITLDFETEAIVGNPLANPPKPVGLAIYASGKEPEYVVGWEGMKEMWSWAIAFGSELLFHNAPFDLSVGTHWFGTPWPDWQRVHDTIYLGFLKDPYSPTLSLKPLSQRYLGMDPNEQDELHGWIIAHVSEATEKTAGAFISRAPVSLVAPYAISDVVRTRRLFDFLYPQVPRIPYDRERRLMPKLAESSRRGIRVDRERLEKDVVLSEAGFIESERRIFDLLGVGRFDLSKGAQLADALEKSGKVTNWVLTPTGKRSTARDNLLPNIADPGLSNLLAYHSVMKTCLTTFMRPWEALSRPDGRLHTQWNQVANDEGPRGHSGTRTGRLSSSDPNLQNVPNKFPDTIPEGLPPLPNMRVYLLPERGHVWIKRDFSSQEVRLLAHFEDGSLMEMYRSDPFFDPHKMAQEMMLVITSQLYARPDVKIVAFSIIYGSGVPGLASQLGRPLEEARILRDAYYQAVPSLPKLAASIKARARSGGCITTWGGRQYFCETKIVDGTVRSFDYKLLNYLIQGSAADQTKEVLCNWWEDTDRSAIFMATVHDEVNASAPAEQRNDQMRLLRLHMDADLFDVPMRSEGEFGPTWGSLTKIKREEEYN